MSLISTTKCCIHLNFQCNVIQMQCGCQICAKGISKLMDKVRKTTNSNTISCPKCGNAWDWVLCDDMTHQKDHDNDTIIKDKDNGNNNNDNGIIMNTVSGIINYFGTAPTQIAEYKVNDTISAMYLSPNPKSKYHRKWYDAIIKKVEKNKIKIQWKNENRFCWINQSDYSERIKCKNIINKSNGTKTNNCNGLIGLKNLGNTCFLNSALQCALQTPKFIDYYKNCNVNNIQNGSIQSAWNKFVQNVYSSNNSNNNYYQESQTTKSLRKLRQKLASLHNIIGTGVQEDSFLALMTLLEGLDDETSNGQETEHAISFGITQKSPDSALMQQFATKKIWEPHINGGGTSIIRKLFDGVECEKLKCMECGFNQYSFRTFRDINLPIVDHQIKLKFDIFVYNSSTPISIQCILSNESSLKSLKVLILKKLNDQDLDVEFERDYIQFGYLNPSNNRNFGQWIKYLKDNENCSNITKGIYGFALVPGVNINCNDDGLNDFKMNSNINSNDNVSITHFIPQYMLSKNNNIKCKEFMDFTFIPFYKPCSVIEGKKIINMTNYSNNYNIAVFYDGKLVTPFMSVKIIQNGSLVLIWSKTNLFQIDNKFIVKQEELEILERSIYSNTKYKSNINSIHDLANLFKDIYNNSLKPNPGVSFIKSIFRINNIQSKNINTNYQNKVKIAYEKYATLSNQLKKAEDNAFKYLWNKWKKCNNNKYKSTSKSIIIDDVEQCLKLYQKSNISDCYSLDCQECGESDLIERTIEILKTPEILIIHIDRDGNNEDPLNNYTKKRNSYYNNNTDKSEKLIKYSYKTPLNLNNDFYALFAVAVHHGYSLNGGHYTAKVKSLQNADWYYMDDMSVTRIQNKNTIVTTNATLLMYHKQPN